jgi:cytidylate kinase
MKAAEDAELVDSSAMSLDEVVEALAVAVERKSAQEASGVCN